MSKQNRFMYQELVHIISIIYFWMVVNYMTLI
jgi:hypothetical protein